MDNIKKRSLGRFTYGGADHLARQFRQRKIHAGASPATDFRSEYRYHHSTALIQEDILDTDRYSVLRQSFSKRRLFTPFIMLCPLKKPWYGNRRSQTDWCSEKKPFGAGGTKKTLLASSPRRALTPPSRWMKHSNMYAMSQHVGVLFFAKMRCTAS